MAGRLCDDLKKAKVDIITKLMIVLFMTHFDSDDLHYDDFVRQDRGLKPLVIKKNCIHLKLLILSKLLSTKNLSKPK